MHFPVSESTRFKAVKPLLLVSVLASCFTTSAIAQEAVDTEEKTLQPVVVTASRVEQLQKDAIPSTTVITSKMIENKKLADLPSLLKSEAGLEIVQSGGPGTVSSVYMRGMNSNQVLIMIDGVPIQDASDVGAPAALEHIMPDQIDHIEIVRGNVSAIYGSGAMGGVIQIFTKQGNGKLSGNVFAEYGSHDTTKISAGVSGKSDAGTRFALSATRFKTNGFSAMSTYRYPLENPDKDGSRNISLNATISQKFSQNHEVGARLFLYDDKYDMDAGGSGPADQIDWGKSKQWTGAIFSKNRFTSDWLSTVTLSKSDIDRDYYSETRWGDFKTNYKSESNLFQWENKIALSPDWILTAGTDIGRDKATISYDNSDYARSKYSVYTGVTGKINSHHLQANLRYDHVDYVGSDVTGYLGYGYDLTSNWKLLASTSTAFLAPTMYQQFDPQKGSKALKAEKSNANEIGVQYAQGFNQIRLSAFEWRTRDLIGYNGTHYYNVGRAKNKGLELNASSRLWWELDVKANITVQDPKNRQTDEDLLYRAKTTASLDVSKTAGLWYFGANAQYTGHRTGSKIDPMTYASSNERMSSFWLLNLNARYNLNKNVSLYARIENLFDKDYETVYGYSQPGRGAYVGVNFKM